MTLLELQKELEFIGITDIDIFPVFTKSETLFVGKAEKITQIKSSIIGLTILISENAQIHDIDNYTYIKSFHYECNGCDQSEIKEIIKGASHILIKNNFKATIEEYDDFNRFLFSAISIGNLKMIYPPNEPSPINVEF